MITFVEHDAEGNIFHVAVIETTEGPDAPSEIHEPAVEPSNKQQRDAARAERANLREARKTRIQEMITERENVTRAELMKHVTDGKPLVILPPGSPIPDADLHAVDISTKRIRDLTPAEKTARAQARGAAQHA